LHNLLAVNLIETEAAMQKIALLEDSHFFPTHFSTDNNKKVIRSAAFGYVIGKDK
jgi:hypothetical protein